MPESRKVLRYSREDVLACRESAARMNFPTIVIPTRVPRGARKKSQCIEADATNVPGGSREDLHTEEANPSWQRLSRHHNNNNNNPNPAHLQQQSHFPAHTRQRYPSGPHADVSHSSTNISLRAAPFENRHGGHGDWSRGCAGWRQRSYSGSERSEVVLGTGHFNFRGRGGHAGSKGGEEGSFRGRGRGRGTERHRGGLSSRGGHPSTNRPVSFIGPVNNTHNTEEFWQDEDWDSVGVDNTAQFDFSSKSRERLNSKTSIEGLSVGSSESPSTGTAATTNAPTELIKNFRKLRVYSKSCSSDPPPGFDLSMPKPITNEKRPTEPPEAVTAQSSVDTEVSNNSPSDVSFTRWYYIDSTGKTQGPFIQQQMSVWFTGGYLPVTIEVRRECDECYLTLGDHMNLTDRIPFSENYPLPPLTRSTFSTIVAASKKSVSNPRWVTPVTSPKPPSTEVSDVSVTPSSIHNVMAAATAAAPALALFFATAAGLTSPVSQQASQTTVQSPFPHSPSPTQSQQSTTIVRDLLKTTETTASVESENPPPSLHRNDPEIIRLYTEAQALAAHAAKVEAERQELVDKIAAINSTAAKLLATSPGLTLASTDGTTAPNCILSCAQETACEPKSILTDTIMETKLTDPTIDPSPSSRLDNQSERQLSSQSDNKSTIKRDVTSEPVLSQVCSQPGESETLNKEVPCDTTEVAGKKNKKKKNKPKKKMTAEQERQLAWNAEFERRKAAALERKLAEEAEAQRLAEEEAAAIAAAEQAQAKEQLRLAAEQRKREAARAKAASQLGQLRLPKTACWGNVSGSHEANPPHPSADGSTSLLEIQAAQALEEAQKKRQEALVAEQAALLAAAEAEAATSKPQAWAAVVNANLKTSTKQAPKPKPVKSDFPSVKASALSDRSKPTQSPAALTSGSKAPTTTPPTTISKVSSSTNAPPGPNSTGPSIWDLPNDGKAEASSGKNSKKHNKKKNAQAKHGGPSFAAKEQLAHWCESQLSSMPLSGVDLPTLVDLLCELEAAEQIVEFIESSLGRSKQISQFSKAFLEKRACVLNAP